MSQRVRYPWEEPSRGFVLSDVSVTPDAVTPVAMPDWAIGASQGSPSGECEGYRDTILIMADRTHRNSGGRITMERSKEIARESALRVERLGVRRGNNQS